MTTDIEKIVRDLLDDNDIIEPRQQLEIFHNQAKEAQARMIQLSVQYRMTSGEEKKKIHDLLVAGAPGLDQLKRDFRRMQEKVERLDRQERRNADKEKAGTLPEALAIADGTSEPG